MLRKIGSGIAKHPKLTEAVVFIGTLATLDAVSLRTGHIADYNFPPGIEKYIDDGSQTLSKKAAYDYARSVFDKNKDGKLSSIEYETGKQLIKDAVPLPLPLTPFNVINSQRNILQALEKIKSEDLEH